MPVSRNGSWISIGMSSGFSFKMLFWVRLRISSEVCFGVALFHPENDVRALLARSFATMAFSNLSWGCAVQSVSSSLERLEVRSFLSAIDFIVSCIGALDGSLVIAVSSAPASPAPGAANSSGIFIDRLRVSPIPNQAHPPASWSPSLLTLWVPVIVIFISSGGGLW